MTTALSIEKVSCYYEGLKALDDVSLHMQKGERHVILGPNGAGKTTLFNVITGEKTPSSGRIMLLGHDVTRLPSDRRAWLGLGRTFQITNIFWDLTVADNVFLGCLAQQRARRVFYRPVTSYGHLKARSQFLLEEFGLRDLARVKAGAISYGEQRQLEIVIALATEPRVLLLDEPTAGLSGAATNLVTHLIKKLPLEITVLLVEHDLGVAFQMSQSATVLHHGQVIAQGSVEEVRENPEVKRIYLGKA